MKTTVKENEQIAKFESKLTKTKNQGKDNSIITKKFNFIDLTAVVAKATKDKPIKERVKTSFKQTPTKEKNYIIPTVFDNTHIEVHNGSIRRFLNECHSDVQTLIEKNEFKMIRPECSRMIVVTRNNLRIVISTTGIFERQVVITDKKKNILFNGKTSVTITKEAKKVA